MKKFRFYLALVATLLPVMHATAQVNALAASQVETRPRNLLSLSIQRVPTASDQALLPIVRVVSPDQVMASLPISKVEPTVVAPVLPPKYSIEQTDKTIREALVRWAGLAGWIHNASHWTVNKDHPVEGTAGPEVFGPVFEQAVRVLVSSTELTDQPVQPCFYTNRVLRIISAAASCNSAD